MKEKVSNVEAGIVITRKLFYRDKFNVVPSIAIRIQEEVVFIVVHSGPVHL